MSETGPRYLRLNNALGHFMDQINHEEGTNQSFRAHGIGGRDPIIHFPDGKPEADITLNLVPGAASNCAKISIHHVQGDEVCTLSPPIPHRYRKRLPAGYYRVSARIEPPSNGYFNCGPLIKQVVPPIGVWSLRVGPQ